MSSAATARLPTPAKLLEILDDGGVLRSRSGRPLASAADALFAPLREHAARQIQRARGEVAEVRTGRLELLLQEVQEPVAVSS